MPLVRFRQLAAIGLVMACAACATAPASAGAASIKVGAVVPLSGPQAALAKQEYAGVQIARDLVNADGGVAGAPIALVTKDLTSESDAAARVHELNGEGVHIILGAYSSSLSMPVSAEAQSRGLLYWEAGAVADQLTGRGYPLVFRVGATGQNLGTMSSHFGAMLGADAIGVFASDRPEHGFNPSALTDTGRAVYARFAAAYRNEFGSDPTEESLAGFSAAWTLFHYVMPRARDLSASAMAAAARSLDLPEGTLANGAGVKFANTPEAMGQNIRAASVIWQWQGVRHSVTVYPPVFATGTPGFIPLPR